MKVEVRDECNNLEQQGNSNVQPQSKNFLHLDKKRKTSSKECRTSQKLEVNDKPVLDSNTRMGESELFRYNVDVKGLGTPYLLNRVLRMEEKLSDDFIDNKLLFLAIHAVFLESGFVGFDSASGLRIDQFHLLQQHSLMTFTTSVGYTLPQLLDDSVTESVVLMFQTIGQFVNVYGSLAKSSGSLVYRLCLDRWSLVPAFDSVSATWEENDISFGSVLCQCLFFEFCKIVKHQLVLPLMIDLCEKTGLTLPPCWMRLPADIKLKILELLPAVSVARMACVCKEMKHLSSNDDLWRQKFYVEFEEVLEMEGVYGFLETLRSKAEPINWKVLFAAYWEFEKTPLYKYYDVFSKKRKFSS